MPTFEWLSKILRRFSRGNADESSKYVDLAPTDKADPDGIYSRALAHATSNPNVYNIALTGPYGSGKSSIIRTFLKSYKKPALQISLAAFLPDADGTASSIARKGSVPRQEIERSILQQMLYGADANRLPFSRFNRIRKPTWWWTALVSLVAILGAASGLYVFSRRDDIFSGEFFLPIAPENWLNFLSLGIAMCCTWFVVAQVYLASHGLSLKSISLRNLEILPKAKDDGSILNRHLDEIIYFFQSTKYALVVVEDLDRFQNPEIFVSLREINSLINANAGVNRHIRFLYALRDNMFASTDRTKFFEFIVPVIPIINSSNSIDKMLEQGERLALDERLDRQFLREVSRYLRDLRLIQNIFNEYAVYVANLETDDENVLNANKLLAILIYKNVLPSDFEELHRGSGRLSSILEKHDEFIVKAEIAKRLEISSIEDEIAEAEKQIPSDLMELRKIYAMSLIEKAPSGCTHIVFENSVYHFNNLPSAESFDRMLAADQLQFRTPQNHAHNVSMARAKKEANQLQSYQERREKIEKKSKDFVTDAQRNIRRIRHEMSSIRFSKFSEIMKLNSVEAEGLLEQFGDNKELIKFLILEGYIDDTYYQYTSLFHSGRLSPSDNKFLIQIRAFKNPDPDYQIDNPIEVIASMRDADFSQNFVLNKTIVDCLFLNLTEYWPQVEKFITFVASNFDQCQEFFSVYYERGKCVSQLLSTLFLNWKGFVTEILNSSSSMLHFAQILAHLPQQNLAELSDRDSRVSVLLSNRLAEILELEIDVPPPRLSKIPFEIVSLKSLTAHPAMARFLIEQGKFAVSAENIDFVFEEIFGGENSESLRTKNYSTILRSGCPVLISKVNGNFDEYLENVLLALENNTQEDIEAIVSVLAHEEVALEALASFLTRQEKVLPSLEAVPDNHYSLLLKLRKVEPSWDNCRLYIESEKSDPATLTEFLENGDVLQRLLNLEMDQGKGAFALQKFIVENDELDDDFYRSYIQIVPRTWNIFPESLSASKIKILVEENKVEFSEETFSALDEYQDVQIRFVAQNLDSYFEQSEKIQIDDSFREKILALDVRDTAKLRVIAEMDLSTLPQMPHRAAQIGSIFYRAEPEVAHLTGEIAQALIINSRPIEVQISLFNRLQKNLADEQVWETISALPKPYSEITPGYRRPTVPNDKEHSEFVRWLEERRIISSWKETFLNEIRIYNFRN